MKRLFFRGEHKFRVAEFFFGRRRDFCVEDYIPYVELEVVLQDDGRFSVWGNLPDDADLLQDTSHDPHHLVSKIFPLADEILEEE
ncbi:MAG TPA: hypothetical protein DHW78_10370 [Ruminococcaceae bacterium]|nr:hypothetical protein [Oscillospiraceae bacterium]HCA71325.1 hypothetical protein [Oscillospiraceae bacterium]HCC02463.1 hypothetical protein [Oscillospiraceae bacterium]HCM24711.1 hypothetical protein [Oscillospiraceae bacterium]